MIPYIMENKKNVWNHQPVEVDVAKAPAFQTMIFQIWKNNVINHPYGNGLYHLFMVIWGLVYYCFSYMFIFFNKIPIEITIF